MHEIYTQNKFQLKQGEQSKRAKHQKLWAGIEIIRRSCQGERTAKSWTPGAMLGNC